MGALQNRLESIVNNIDTVAFLHVTPRPVTLCEVTIDDPPSPAIGHPAPDFQHLAAQFRSMTLDIATNSPSDAIIR